MVTLVGLRGAQVLDQAAGESPHLLMSPGIADAGAWLAANNTGGNIMVSPHTNQVPSRMMLAMGDYSSLQSFEYGQILRPRDLPPTGSDPLTDVLHTVTNPTSDRAKQALEKHDVRYVVLYKNMPDRPTADYWRRFKARPDLYPTAFENEDVLIVAVSSQPSAFSQNTLGTPPREP